MSNVQFVFELTFTSVLENSCQVRFVDKNIVKYVHYVCKNR